MTFSPVTYVASFYDQARNCIPKPSSPLLWIALSKIALVGLLFATASLETLAYAGRICCLNASFANTYEYSSKILALIYSSREQALDLFLTSSNFSFCFFLQEQYLTNQTAIIQNTFINFKKEFLGSYSYSDFNIAVGASLILKDRIEFNIRVDKG